MNTPWHRRFLFLATLGLALALQRPAPGQIRGAVFTTDAKGEVVNQNVYSSRRNVYIGGGPGPGQPCSAAGLPSGDYFFQVTDPAGTTLLTVDPITNRKVTVTNGVISSYKGTRKTGKGPCNSVTVQLNPDPTPNSSGEYRVWLTPTDNYDLTWAGFFGFIPKYSKTDNFKIRSGKPVAQSIIRGFKFYDFSGNGRWDSGVPEELPIAGWRFELWKGGVRVGITFTDDIGRFTFMQDQDGSTCVIKEVPPPPGFIPAQGARWHPTTATEQTVVVDGDNVLVPDFGNVSFTDEPVFGLARSKGYWHNQGRSVLLACDQHWRTTINGTQTDPVCLRRNISSLDPDVSIFTVPLLPTSFDNAFDSLSNYLVGDPTLGHAGFILSVQVCATLLNTACGPLSQHGLVAVDVAGDDRLVLLTDLIAGAKGLLCDPRAGKTLPGENEDFREKLLGCVNEFEQVNSETESTHTPSTTATEFDSPYGQM